MHGVATFIVPSRRRAAVDRGRGVSRVATHRVARGRLPHNSLPGAVMMRMSKSLTMLFMGVGGVAALLATSGAVNSQEDGRPATKGSVPKGAARKFGGPGGPGGF